MFAFEACCFPPSTITTAATEDECPMKHEDGAACPMHRSTPKDVPCALRAACHSDMSGLAVVFISNAVTGDAFVFLEDDFSSASFVSTPFTAPQAPPSADTPPPRA
jgi:hypothetical protein